MKQKKDVWGRGRRKVHDWHAGSEKLEQDEQRSATYNLVHHWAHRQQTFPHSASFSNSSYAGTVNAPSALHVQQPQEPVRSQPTSQPFDQSSLCACFRLILDRVMLGTGRVEACKCRM